MCLSVGIGLLIAHLGEASGGSWRARLRAFIHWILSPKMLLRLMLVLMVIALVLSRSRMGNSSFFIAMLAAGVIALLLSRYATRSVTILLISLIIIDIFIVGTWFGLEQVKQRIEETTVQTETRDEVSLDSLEYWQDYFWTGSGLGSYRYVIPKYQHVYLTGWFDQAHNDYLQFGAETGFLGLSLVAMLLLFSLFAAVIAQLRRRNPLLRGLGFAATMGILALLIHAHVEFNFQITANAATAVVLMALAWVALYAPRQSRRQPQQHDHHHHHTRHQSRSHGVNGLSALGRNVSILGIVVSVLITLTAVIWLKAHIAASHAEYYLKHESQTDTDWQ
jgi:O-antigen ligase